ncbi:MAG: peptidylprolyl isomerase [Candidatus Omnitrophica bacterium]|nr:peptidylprolyl isomerase [Candidatus Omnitrophota bacterium]
MMKSRCRIALLIASVATFAALGALAGAEVVDKIAIVVNDEIITQGEIDETLAPIYEQYRAVYYGDELMRKVEEARRKVIAQIIEDRLVLSEAKRQGITVEEAEIDARIADTMKRFGSYEQFEKVLAQQGMTMKKLRLRYKEQIMSRKLIDQKVGGKIAISPVEVSDYYKAHFNEYIQPEEVRVRNILIRPRQGMEPEAALILAQDVCERAKKGEDFSELVKRYSEGPHAEDGGDLGYVKRGDLLPEIEKIVFILPEGQVSEVIQTGLGYHVFKVEAKRERRPRTLSEVRHEVEEAIFRQKVSGKLRGWMESLKKNGYIAFK